MNDAKPCGAELPPKAGSNLSKDETRVRGNGAEIGPLDVVVCQITLDRVIHWYLTCSPVPHRRPKAGNCVVYYTAEPAIALDAVVSRKMD